MQVLIHTLKKSLKLISFLLTQVAILLVLGYRYILSPILPSACRYRITCSEYAIFSFKKHGLIIGLWKTLKRLGSCHPFCNYVDEDFK
ncbi:MAG: membrane protein insertion efficiency factor YidD [Candidatus Midichloria sp.]